MKKEDVWENADTSIEEIAQRCLDELSDEERKVTKEVTFYKGVSRLQTFEKFLDVSDIIYKITEYAYEECGEVAEDYLSGLTSVEINDLENLMISWAEKHNLNPTFSMIEDIEEITFTIPEDWD